jgi:Fe-S-cluster containining protein
MMFNFKQYKKAILNMQKFFDDIEAEARKRIKPYPGITEDFESALKDPRWKTIDEAYVVLFAEYQDKFCDKCGECCRRVNKIVLNNADIENISKYLNISPKKFKKRFKIIPDNFRYYMPAKPCPFLKNNLCSIYPARPLICKLFPAYDMLVEMKKSEGKEIAYVNFPTYCNIVKELYINKLLMLVFYYYLKRTHPEHAEKLERFGEISGEILEAESFDEAVTKAIQYRELIKKLET